MLKKQCLGTTLNNGVAVNNGPVNVDIGNGGVRARGLPFSQSASCRISHVQVAATLVSQHGA